MDNRETKERNNRFGRTRATGGRSADCLPTEGGSGRPRFRRMKSFFEAPIEAVPPPYSPLRQSHHSAGISSSAALPVSSRGSTASERTYGFTVVRSTSSRKCSISVQAPRSPDVVIVLPNRGWITPTATTWERELEPSDPGKGPFSGRERRSTVPPRNCRLSPFVRGTTLRSWRPL